MPHFVLSPTAQRDLRSIRVYLAGAPEPVRLRVIAELVETCWQAVRFPESGRLEPELQRPGGAIIRSLLCHPYRVFYYPESSPRKIFAIIHGKQDPISVLKSSR